MSDTYILPRVGPPEFTPAERLAYAVSSAATLLGLFVLTLPAHESPPSAQHELRLETPPATLEVGHTMAWYGETGGAGAAIALEGLGLAAVTSRRQNRRVRPSKRRTN